MFNSGKKDKQVEFFSDYSCLSKKSQTPKFTLSKVALSLSYENIFLLSIGLIMLLIVCYSLGVEKGKVLAQAPKDTIEIRADNTQKESSQDTQATEQTEEAAPKQDTLKHRVEIVSLPAYTIQVATFVKSTSVEKEIQRLKKQGYSSFVLSRGKYREICIGSYKEVKDANGDLKELKKLYGDCFVRKQ